MQPIPFLPSSPQQKLLLKSNINQLINQLSQRLQQQRSNNSSINEKQIKQIEQKLEILSLRLSLIDKCQEFSLYRLNHLEEIFKYYCTHIFKIGKHMTFDRLEYQKEHLNTERFFLFLKDFTLTSTIIQGKPKQIITKQAIMTIFKKISSNSRDFTFQQFIKCLQKIAIVYYDQKSNYWNKIQEEKLQRIKRKMQIQKRKIKRMKQNGQKIDQKQLQQVQKLQKQQDQINLQSSRKLDNDNKQEQILKKQVQAQVQVQVQVQVQNQNQNDQLIKQMMQNSQLQDPNQQITKIVTQKKQQTLQIQKSKKQQKDYQKKLLTLTNNQRIQYFYLMIGIDSIKEFKSKLTILNMTVFNKSKGQKTQKQIKNTQKTIDQPQMERSASLQENQREQRLKQKMNQKKAKLKEKPIPKPKQIKQSQTAKQRRQMKMQRQLKMQQKALQKKQQQQQAMSVKKKQTQKSTKVITKPSQVSLTKPIVRASYNQKQVSWSMLQNLQFQQLKLRQFNPTKLYHQDQDDHIFMQQYGNFKTPNRNLIIEQKERKSMSIVQDVKKRILQVGNKEERDENKLMGKVSQGRKSIKGKF